MRIACFGAGSWGFVLASLFAANGHEVHLWDRNASRLASLKNGLLFSNMHMSTDIAQTIQSADIALECVTAAGLRPLCQTLSSLFRKGIFILTSKGIEQNSGILLLDVVTGLLDASSVSPCVVSGPSYAEEVAQELPTSLVCASEDAQSASTVRALLTRPFLRLYVHDDPRGVSLGGALKNIIAIACGISDGLGFGVNAKAALMTRGLHEMRRLAPLMGCRSETLMGLSGMGDLALTCLSPQSRNFRFGFLLAQGKTPHEAKEIIGAAVEGAYTCLSAWQLALRYSIDMPITEQIHAIIYMQRPVKAAVSDILSRSLKDESA